MANWRAKLANIDTWRKGHLAVAEWIDAWRVIPRLLVAGYGWVVYKVIIWYMDIENRLIEGCNVEILKEACVIQAPNTQHAALVTAVVGISAAIFAFYTNTGKKWNGFTHWNKEVPPQENADLESREVVTKSVYRADDEGDGG